MALTLSRKATQSIYIGTARVTVKRIQRGRVIFDIDAPRDVPIHRSEIAAAAQAGRLAELRDAMDQREQPKC